MAKTNIEKENLRHNAWGDVEFTKVAAGADGALFDMTGKDYATLIIVHNTSASAAATITVKAGDGLQGVNDLAAYEVAAGGFAAIRIDAGEFKRITGDDKGAALITVSSNDVEIAVVELP